MKPGQIFSKTLPFVWAKLLLGLATVLISVVILAVLLGIAYLIGSGGVGLVMIIIWVSVTGFVNFLLNHYFGYLVKAGHIAVITEAVVTGKVPDNQVNYGKEKVKERFVSSNVYFVIDKLVSRAVSQIQRKVEQLFGGLMGNIPGMNMVTNVVKLFIGISLGYIDECCLGYTFFKKEQGAFKSAADGVVIYAQNSKKLLRDAAKTTLIVVGLVVVVTLVAFALFGGVAYLVRENVIGSHSIVGNEIIGAIAFLLAAFVAWVIKKSFVDSYILVNMMVSYMEVAPTTELKVDIYNKLCGWSSKFKELFTKGQQEKNPEPTSAPAPQIPATGEKPIFCGECGAKNERGTKFCGECGKPIS